MTAKNVHDDDDYKDIDTLLYCQSNLSENENENKQSNKKKW